MSPFTLEQAGIVVGLAVGSLAIIGPLLGAAWWMSALYAQVSGLRRDMQRLADSMDREHSTLWGRIDQHAEKIEDHEVRIARLEP